MSTSRKVFALYLSGWDYAEIDNELALHKGRAQLIVMHIQLMWEVADYGKD